MRGEELRPHLTFCIAVAGRRRVLWTIFFIVRHTLFEIALAKSTIFTVFIAAVKHLRPRFCHALRSRDLTLHSHSLQVFFVTIRMLVARNDAQLHETFIAIATGFVNDKRHETRWL